MNLSTENKYAQKILCLADCVFSKSGKCTASTIVMNIIKSEEKTIAICDSYVGWR
jgi:hypothetical protein